MRARILCTLGFPHRGLRLAAVLFFALAIAGAVHATEDAIIDPCKLVTPAEVEVVLGTPVLSSLEGHVRDPVKFPIRICIYHGKNGKTLNVSTGAKEPADFDAEWLGRQAVPGIGESAYTVPPGVLTFHKGASTVLFQAINFNFARDGHGQGYSYPVLAEKLKTLALAAVGRM